MLFNLLAARARCGEIFFGITCDFRLAALPAFDFVAYCFEPRGQFRAVDRRGILLSLVEFSWLQRVSLSVFGFREIEENHVSVQLRGGVTVYRPCAIMFELRRDPLAGCLCWKVPAGAGLDVSLQFIKRGGDTLLMSLSYSFVPAYECCEGYALGCGERRVPARAVLHRSCFLAVFVHVFSCRLVADELLAAKGMLTFGESLEVFLANLTA